MASIFSVILVATALFTPFGSATSAAAVAVQPIDSLWATERDFGRRLFAFQVILTEVAGLNSAEPKLEDCVRQIVGDFKSPYSHFPRLSDEEESWLRDRFRTLVSGDVATAATLPAVLLANINQVEAAALASRAYL